MAQTANEPSKTRGNTVAAKALWTLEKLVATASKVGNPPFFEKDVFPWVADLEANWQVMRKEVDQILLQRDLLPNFQDISKDQVSITTDDKWKTYFLYGMGFKADKNCERCPETTRLVEQIPGMTTAFFSILYPGKHIPAHRGVYKGFIRYHLGLKVPEPNTECKIRVHDQYEHWEEGKSIIFDDTYDHEVWNNTDGIRVVLFMDVLRPLSFPMSVLNAWILRRIQHSGFVQDAKRNQEMWEKRLEQAGMLPPKA